MGRNGEDDDLFPNDEETDEAPQEVASLPESHDELAGDRENDFSLPKAPKRQVAQAIKDEPSPIATAAKEEVAATTQAAAAAQPPSEPTIHDRVLANNPERFKSLRQADANKQDPIEIDQLALAGRFAQMGDSLRKKWLKPSDPKDREKITKALVEAEAADEMEGYQGKDYQHKLKAAEKRLAASALGLGDLAEFQDSKAEKKAKDDLKTESEKPGALKYSGLSFVKGVEKGVAGLMEFTAAASGFVQRASVEAAERRGGSTWRNDKLDAFGSAFDKWLTDKAASIRTHADTWTEGKQNQAQQQAETALHTALEKGSVSDVAGAVLGNPRLWASEGANLVGVMAGSGGATGVARWSVMKSVGAASKLALSNPGVVAGFTGEALAGTQSAWDHLAGDDPFKGTTAADKFSGKRDTKIWQYTAARMPGATEKQIDDTIVKTLKNEDLPRQTAIQMLAFATGRAPAQMIAQSLGVQLAAKTAGYTGGAAARVAKGAASSAAVGGAQGLGSEISTRATIENAKNDKGFIPSAVEAASHAEAWNNAALTAMFGIVPGGIHGARSKAVPKPAKPQAPEDSAVGSPPPPRLPPGASAKLRPDVDAEAVLPRQDELIMPPHGEENTPGFDIIPNPPEALPAKNPNVIYARAPTDPLALPKPGHRPSDDFLAAHAELDASEPSAPVHDLVRPSAKAEHPGAAPSAAHDALNPEPSEAKRYADIFETLEPNIHPEDRAAIQEQIDALMKDPDVQHAAGEVEKIYDAVDEATGGKKDTPAEGDELPKVVRDMAKTARTSWVKKGDYVSDTDLSKPAHESEVETSIAEENKQVDLKPDLEVRTDTGSAPDVATRQQIDEAKAANIEDEMAKNHGELGTKTLTDNFYKGTNGWQLKAKRQQLVNEARGRANPTPEDAALLAANDLAKASRKTKKGPSAVESRIAPEEREALRKSGSISLAALHEEMAAAGKDMERMGITTHAVATEAEARSRFPEQLGDRENFKSVYFKDDAGRPHVLTVAENLKNPADARLALEHEVIGHHAVEHILGEEGLRAFHVEIARAAHAEPKVAKMLRRVRENYPDYSHDAQMNEFIAQLVQPATPFRSAARNIMRWLQQTLSNLGMRGLGTSKLQDFRDAMRDLSESYRRDLPKDKVAERLTDYIANGYSRQTQKNLVTEGANVIEPNKWLDNQKLFGDRMAYVHASLEAMGAKASDAELAVRALSTKKAQLIKGVIYDKHLQPLQEALGKLANDTGRSYDAMRVHFDRYLSALHTEERNMAMRRISAPLKDPALTKQREQIVNEYMRGDTSADQARTRLDAIVTDVNIENPSWHEANVNKAGRTNTDAKAELAKYEKLGLTEEFERLNRAEVDSLRNVTAEHNYKGGWWDRRINDLNGYKNYVPLRGTEIDTQIKRRWEKPLGIMHETQQRMRGREDLADHNLAQMFTEAELAANRMLNNELLNKYRKVIDRHTEKYNEQNPDLLEAAREKDPEAKLESPLGNNVELDASLPGYDGNKFHYAERPARHEVGDMRVYDPDSGKHYDMLLKDKNVVEAFSKSQLTKMDESKFLTRLAATTRFQSRVVTAWNPKYWYSQFARDVPSSFLISFSEHKVGDERPLGQAPTVATRWQALRETASMTVEAFKNEDMRRLFAGSAGARDTLINNWRSDIDYGLGDRYRGDAEGLQWARETRQHMIDYYDQGGVLDFAGQMEYGNVANSDPLARSSQVAQKAAGASHFLDSAVQLVDAAHRFGLYTAAVKAGVPKAEAAIRARTIQDFSQRGAYNDSTTTPARYAKASLMFLQANLTTVEAMFAKRIWKGGEMPTEMVQTPDGYRQQLKSDWYKQLNTPVAGFLMASGFANVAIMSQIMGSDENGTDNAAKLHPKSWMNIGGYTLPNPFGGAPIITPGQYGINRLMTGLGTAVGLVAHGYADPHEVATEMTNLGLENLAPIGKVRSSEEGESTLGMLLSGLSPAMLQPLVQASFNTNAFGTKIAPEIDPRRPRYASESGRNTTPQEWHELARNVREAGGPDFAPEVFQHIVRGYTGAAGAIMDDLFKTASGVNSDRGYLNAMGLAPRQNFSADSYESRELAKFRHDHINPLAKEWDLAKQKDQRASPEAPSSGRSRSIGDNERAFLEIHPEFKDMATADRNFAKASRVLSLQMQAAREAGDANKLQEIRVQQKKMTGDYVRALHAGDTGAMRSIGQ